MTPDPLTREEFCRRLRTACDACDTVSPYLVDLLEDHDAALRDRLAQAEQQLAAVTAGRDTDTTAA